MTDWLPLILFLVALLGLSVFRGIRRARELREGRGRARGAPPIREDSAGDDFGSGS